MSTLPVVPFWGRLYIASVTVAGDAVGVASLTLTLTNQIGGGQVAKAASAIFAASGGRPEVWPNPSTWAAVANTSAVDPHVANESTRTGACGSLMSRTASPPRSPWPSRSPPVACL